MAKSQASILIVTVTKVESKAVLDVFYEATGHVSIPTPIADRIYHNLGIINGINVFMVRSEMGSGGLGASQQTVQKGIDALSPVAVIMVGIAFGIDSEKQTIGDILVSQRLLPYELQRIGQEDDKLRIILRDDQPHASVWLLDRLKSAELYWDESKCEVRFGTILSGEKLVDNIDFRQQLRGLGPEAIGGEMEGRGLYVTCQDRNVDWILVKAICDWADGHKSQDKNERQRLAAHNAASFVSFMLQQAPLTREGDQANLKVRDVPLLKLSPDIDFSPPAPADEQLGAKRSWFIRLKVENSGQTRVTNCFGRLLKVLTERKEHLKQYDALTLYWTRQSEVNGHQPVNIYENDYTYLDIAQVKEAEDVLSIRAVIPPGHRLVKPFDHVGNPEDLLPGTYYMQIAIFADNTFIPRTWFEVKWSDNYAIKPYPCNIVEIFELSTSPQTKEKSTSALRVLFLEDEPQLVETLPIVLQEINAELRVVGTSDIAEALARIEREDFDAVLLDISMPPSKDMFLEEIEYGRLTGIVVAQRIRKLKPDIPIVALTVVSDVQARQKMRDAGITDVINKPAEIEEIIHILLRNIKVR